MRIRLSFAGLAFIGLAAPGCLLSDPPASSAGDVRDHTPAPPGANGVWTPPPGTTFQWQISGEPIDTTINAEVYDIDLFNNDAAVVAALHAAGRRVIAYISVGSWEEYRPDAADFPPAVVGNVYDGYPDERWLDIRQIEHLAPVLKARLDLARAKGFDGVEPDNIDGYQNATGFPLTADDQLRFNRWLAAEAHARGLSIGLKNDPEQAAALAGDFDWALTEDCFDQGWCDQAGVFVDQGKAVFAVEYTDTGARLADFCGSASSLGFTAVLKRRELDDWVQFCP